MRRRSLFFLASTSMTLCACLGSVSDHGPDGPYCPAGEIHACTCASGDSGFMTCLDDGSAYTDCECDVSFDLFCKHGICTDRDSGLLWQQTPAPDTFSWMEATVVCEESKQGGHDDWRLPTADELRSLVRACPTSEPGGSCGVTAGCVEPWCGDDCPGCTWNEGPGENGCYWPPELTGNCWAYWTSTRVGGLTEAWFVEFDSAKVAYKATDDFNQARCVRSP